MRPRRSEGVWRFFRSSQFRCGIENESQQVVELTYLKFAILPPVIKVYDDDAMRWRYDDILAAVTTCGERTRADVSVLLNILFLNPPHIPRPCIRIGLRALRYPLGWNDLLVVPPAGIEIEPPKAREVTGREVHRIGWML